MTTVTDNGIDYFQDRGIGTANGPIDTVVLGTGSGSESETSSGVDSQAYSGTDSNGNITIESVSQTGRFEARVEIQGGTEVPGGTEITEMAIRASADGVCVAIDTFESVKVKTGETEEFTMPVQIQR